MTTTTAPTTMDVEASTLGLPPGYWPALLSYAGLTFRKTGLKRDRDGDVAFAHYRTDAGTHLTVWND